MSAKVADDDLYRGSDTRILRFICLQLISVHRLIRFADGEMMLTSAAVLSSVDHADGSSFCHPAQAYRPK